MPLDWSPGENGIVPPAKTLAEMEEREKSDYEIVDFYLYQCHFNFFFGKRSLFLSKQALRKYFEQQKAKILSYNSAGSSFGCSIYIYSNHHRLPFGSYGLFQGYRIFISPD